MTWVKLEDNFYDHPDFVDCELDEVGLWARALAFCGRHLTDGFIPDAMVTRLGRDMSRVTSAIQGLLGHKLLEIVPGGYRIKNYLKWQTSRDKALGHKSSAAVRKERSRAKKKALEGDIGHGVTCHMVTRDQSVTEASQVPAATATDTTTATEIKQRDAGASHVTVEPDERTTLPSPANEDDAPDSGIPERTQSKAMAIAATHERYARAFADGVSRATGRPCTLPDERARGVVASVVVTHAKGLRGPAVEAWIVESVFLAFTAKPDFADYGGFSPKNWEKFLNSPASAKPGRIKQPDCEPIRTTPPEYVDFDPWAEFRTPKKAGAS